MAVLNRDVRRRLERPLLTFLLSLAIAVCLGVVVYITTGALPYLASSPTTDPTFGNQNHCLLGALPVDRTGFAVWGEVAVGYSGSRLARCVGAKPAELFEVTGVTRAAFDSTGALWYARRAEPNTPPELWRLEGPKPERIGEVAPLGLIGTAFGVVTLDAQGRLVSLDRERTVLGVAQLRAAPPGDVQLTVSADGERVAVVTSGGVLVYDAQRLGSIRAESPCEVEFLWWRKEGHKALLSCGPESSWALELDVDTGAKETAPKLQRARSELVASRGLYVQECEHLPCTASSP